MKEKLLKFAIAFWVVLIPSLLLVVATKDTFVDVDVAQPEKLIITKELQMLVVLIKIKSVIAIGFLTMCVTNKSDVI